ncbi:MAG: CDP-diacylglycerol--glycerol-3-phosphate 3-phosphatidyltransferase [Spirochaetaceae bacterium]|nr:CDP-diacylglycerol--glycerol-3-phosphate 3-phosphatidyltransferase [Spirochaetaceae bacterium]MCF7948228.1 CDP-diacylglycerol--glycerol-3-phosphate 3-phosphatidyltransferase [Spirochaetia bacterium]MCF7951832.1 CDP-diacylglycerol--glycerol-3-phosphate 3-phosphatidyltransferase [Spirochaetaceae bacterium]
MNLPNTLTLIRIILAPIFFAAFFFAEWTGAGHIVSLVILVLVFAVMEVSDFLDGYFARKYHLVTEIGKVIDPFGDVMSRMTYFFCFTLIGLMPAWIFLILLYRELGITFLRMLMIRRGIAMAASVWGKAKAVTYAAGGVLGLGYTISMRIDPSLGFLPSLKAFTLAVFILGALSSVLSFITYIRTAASDLR